jgi:hypothetical protein
LFTHFIYNTYSKVPPSRVSNTGIPFAETCNTSPLEPEAKARELVLAPNITPFSVKLVNPVPPYSVPRTFDNIRVVIVVLPVSVASSKSANPVIVTSKVDPSTFEKVIE